MDDNGIHFQLTYNQLDFLMVPGDIEKILQLENEKTGHTFSSSQSLPANPNNGFVLPTFFHPSEEEELSPIEGDDVITNLQNLGEISPESAMKSLSELVIESPVDDFTIGVETSTSVMNTTAQTTTTTLLPRFHLINNSSSIDFNSTREWASEEIGAVFIVCLMIPFIICSNLLVISSVIRFRRLHTPTNYFITSLAAVDIIVGLITPLVIAVQIFQYGGEEAMSETIVCLIPNRILMMSCGVSLLNLATIAYDRHTALICPLEYVNIMTSRKVLILMISSWLYSSFIVWLPLMLGWYGSPYPSHQCSVDHLHQKAHILFISAIFVPSCTVILICYSRIFLVARHHAKSIAAVEFAVHRRLQVRFMIKDTKYAKTLALVIGGFLALWLPYLIHTFLKTVCDLSSSVWLETYLILLAVFNSGINPWIYAFKNNEFQAAFKRMAREHCSGIIFCHTHKRSSLVSCVSATPRLSRTDSRMASTILEYPSDRIVHRSLDFVNSIESDSSDYNPDSCRNTGTENTHETKSKYLYPNISMTYEIECTTEKQNKRSNLESILLENAVKSKSDIPTSKSIPDFRKDELYSPLKTALSHVRKTNTDNLTQLKKITQKGAEIIRSSSALSAIRPRFLPIHRRPSSSLPSSPIQVHDPLKRCPAISDKAAPDIPSPMKFSPSYTQPPSLSLPSSHIYQTCLP